MNAFKKIGCIADTTEQAQNSLKALQKHYDITTHNLSSTDVIIVLGGDGFMLHSLHHHLYDDIPIYGMNCGTVGFLLNAFSEDNLLERLNNAKFAHIRPLKMTATTVNGEKHEAIAINEVSLLRETYQAAHLRVIIDGSVQIDEMVCDGALVATAAGSTAYNFSVGGPILPLDSNVLALTPISPFRPRRWKGALLPHKSTVQIEVLNPQKRPVSAVADFTEVRDIKSVEIREKSSSTLKLLFDEGHSLEERIIQEQFTI